MLTNDPPPEEADELKPHATANGLDTVLLTAPTIAEVATQAETIVKKLPPGSRMLDIHAVPEDLVA